jgi:hypothetical protein
MLTQNVAEGIHRIAHAHTNCYLVEDGGTCSSSMQGCRARGGSSSTR